MENRADLVRAVVALAALSGGQMSGEALKRAGAVSLGSQRTLQRGESTSEGARPRLGVGEDRGGGRVWK